MAGSVIHRIDAEDRITEVNDAWYRSMVHAVHRKVTPLLIPFRCDSPSEERHMTMTLAPGHLSEVVFICALQYAFAVPPDRSAPPREAQATMVECDGCHRIRTEGGWRDCWDVIVARDIEIDDRAIAVLHTRCPSC